MQMIICCDGPKTNYCCIVEFRELAYHIKYRYHMLSYYSQKQGWIQHDLVRRGGGCSASSGAELCRSCVPPAHQLASLLQSLA
jgi:hypothetical protein